MHEPCQLYMDGKKLKIIMSSAKSRKSVLLTDYIYVTKGYSVVFLIFYSKGYVEMTKILSVEFYYKPTKTY